MLIALLLSALGASPARAAAPFNPVVTASLGTDAARAPSSFSLKITQQDGEEQIGPLSISLPRNGFSVNTDVPGANRQQIGTIRVVLYTGTAPGRAPLTIEGTLNDDNDTRAGCGAGSGRQCILAILEVPGVGSVNAQIEISEADPAVYAIVADLTSTWADPSVAQIDGRLAELSTTLFAKVGDHTVVRNADADTWPLRYSFTSANVPGRSLTGGLQPACAPGCKVDLVTKEYAPTPPFPQAPAAGAAFLGSAAPIEFAWTASTDRNVDPVTYTLILDGQPVYTGSALRTSVNVGPGQHSWQVRADDDHGGSSPLLAPRSFTVIDPNAAQVFTSAISGDRLYIVPGAFVYRINNNPYPLGAETASATADRGYVAFTGGFTLAIAYDAQASAASGYLNLGSLHRIFIDAPGP
ncbi:MAG: hypothetical protein ACT4OV_07950 [Microthrixaceae bacterium]